MREPLPRALVPAVVRGLRRSVLAVALLAATGCTAGHDEPGGSSQDETRPPNIVYIMADDLGYADLSSYGRSDYSTPALDLLAAEGTRFTQAYAIAPICTPTRVGLMTGQYPARHRVGLFEPLQVRFEHEGLDPATPTLSRYLKGAGYHTALVGKWHLGRAPRFRPGAHGFDRWFSILSGAADYASHTATEPGAPDGPRDLYDNAGEVHANGYLTDLFTRNAEDFLRSTAEPFFLNVEYTAPHWPWQQRGDPPYSDGAQPRSGGSPEVFAGMVKALDEGVAQILAVLHQIRYDERTIVIFTSDNGGERWSDMGPFRGRKGQLWEGGIRVPAIVRWPGIVPAGVSTGQVATTLDWTATMLAAARVGRPAGLDGVDLLPHLRGEAPPRERTIYWRSTRFGVQHAVRDGDWKYLRIESPRSGARLDAGEYLFDLAVDPRETMNLVDGQPDRRDRLERLYAEWEATLLDPIEAGPAPRSTD